MKIGSKKKNVVPLVGLFQTMVRPQKWLSIFKLWKHFTSYFLWSCLEDPVIISLLYAVHIIQYKQRHTIFHSFKHTSRCFSLSALSVNEVSLFQMSRVLHLSHPVKMELAYQYPPGATRSSTALMPQMKRTAVRHRCPCCKSAHVLVILL